MDLGGTVKKAFDIGFGRSQRDQQGFFSTFVP
jgi:hypothetical protein